MQKIGEIKSEIQAAEPEEYAALFDKYKEDENKDKETEEIKEELEKDN